MRLSLILVSVSFVLLFWSLPALAGCYDEQIGQEYTLRVGEQMCLKNRKWNCKPVCFFYAGMISEKGFSLLVPRQQGGMNLYYPAKKGGIITLVDQLFEEVEITPDKGIFKYKGEVADGEKQE